MSNIDDRNEAAAVRVIVRERPARDSQTTSVISYLGCSADILVADGRPFTFDKVLVPAATQEELFRDIRPLVDKVKKGYNCTALAYGQTGTGKSHSMGLNSSSSAGEDVGIIPRCLLEILQTDVLGPESSFSSEVTVEIYASFIEIYNEKVFDLLSENTNVPIIARGYKYTGGTRKVLKTMDDCHCVLQQGNKNRHVRPTKMNSQSSRSHAIFTIHVHTVSEKGVINTRLNLVDLAGSEGVRRTGHQGVAMSEGVNINQGLLSIGKVLQAKALGHKVIPYRDSVLTSVLQDSLNENSYLTLLACISPHRADLTETLSTLRFAQSVKQLKHSPHISLMLAESKKNRMKTPKKPTITPAPKKGQFCGIAVSLDHKALKVGYHSNTFCTPSKLKRNNIVDKLNQSEMGLTPKQKEKARTGMHAPLVPELSTIQSNFPSRNRESSILMDQSLDSVSSSTINVSSSTIFGNDGPTSSKTLSYSPIMRKCMAEIENVMESKMSQFLETLKDLSKENFKQQTTIMEKNHSKENVGKAKNTPLSNGNGSESTLLESSLIGKYPKCQLFTASSPVFKVPAVPTKGTAGAEEPAEILYLPANASEVHEDSTCSKVELRRSRRISQRLQYNSFTNLNGCGTVNETLRRSRRISAMRERQSSIDAAHLNILESDKGNGRPINNSKQHKSVRNCVASLNNSVIERYFGLDSKKAIANVKINKPNIQKHRKDILDLLNTGSIKELQILPQIGQKMAFQLVTHRTFSGKFKNMTQLEKLPIWRGNSWTRFAQANLLVD
ncbi:kinesin-like protein Nod isoform X2 [Anastrepha obliqua]|uniref:kinesin-like protein Nod isoform X2 n=1 Tax=Anastrepha obliqua TaxID=95512 RepID=UPI0024097D92|nr:kinesin-like protein Nod isoform X2 [Anastrepha obliqua]